jgi:hypothetical protein
MNWKLPHTTEPNATIQEAIDALDEMLLNAPALEEAASKLGSIERGFFRAWVRRARESRRQLIALIACLAFGCAPRANTSVKHASCSTAAAPELTSCPYREPPLTGVLVESSGLECEHCNVAEFSR